MGAERAFVASTLVRAPQEPVWELLRDTSRYADSVENFKQLAERELGGSRAAA